MFQFISRSGNLTEMMSRLYVSIHPDDFSLHFRTICSDIFSIEANCAIFYEEDPAASFDEEELRALFSKMRLIVVPVTQKLLKDRCRSTDVEIPYALEHNIPVLPILAEEDREGKLISAFNETEVFRGLQFLNRYDRDPTALRYEDKLGMFLHSVLLSEDEVRRVQDEFSSRIFLSYRKKDREHALGLMRRIHKVDVCRDTAIWYDEYLIPGESFDENIMTALNESDVFVMSVTTSFEEPGNYVADHEYPDAVRKNKPLVAADMKHFDQDSLDHLETLYPGINLLMIDPEDSDTFGVTLKQRLIEEAGISEEDLRNNDGEHLYYIAVAYKNGIRTEMDSSRAADIFGMSADQGCFEAYLRLIRMYRLGDGVPKNIDTALEWCEKAEKVLIACKGHLLRTDKVLASVYEEKGIILVDLKQKEEALLAYRSAFELRKKMQKMYEDAPLGDYCESMINVASLLFDDAKFEDARDIASGFIEENAVLMDNNETLSMLRIRARICSFISVIYIQLRQHSEVIRYTRARLDTCRQIEAITGAVEDLRILAYACLSYADFIKNTDPAEADTYIDQFTKIQLRLSEYEKDKSETISDAIDTFSIADNMLLRMCSGDSSAPERAVSLYNQVLDICNSLMDGESRYEAILLTAEVYRRFGDMETAIKGSLSKAMENYKKALDICKNLEKEYRNDYQLMQKQSALQDRIGAMYLRIDDLTNASQYFTDALEIDMRLSRLVKDPASKHNLAKSYMRCAEVNRERGHQPVADVNNRSALKILEPLVQSTDDYRIIEDLALVNFRLGMSERLSTEQRLEYFKKASHIYDELMKMTNNALEYVNAYHSVQKHIEEIS